jgi:hypothetical protein
MKRLLTVTLLLLGLAARAAAFENPRQAPLSFGHYWNTPPIGGVHDAFVPPFPRGHPDLRARFEDHHQDVPPS